MKKILKAAAWIMMLSLLLCACGGGKGGETIQKPESEKQVENENANANKKIKVLMFYSYSTTDAEGKVSIAGPSSCIGSTNVTNELVYKKLVEQFAEENDIQVEMGYGDLQLDNANSYDVIIGYNYKLSDMSLYEKVQEIPLYDMNYLFEEDVIYDGSYIESILEAGRINGEQIIFPLSFNLNLLYTSAQSLEQNGLSISQNSTFDEITDAFMTGWNQTNDVAPLYLRGNKFFMYLTESDFKTVVWPLPYHTFLLAGGYSSDVTYYADILKLCETYLTSDLQSDLNEIRLAGDLSDISNWGDGSLWEESSLIYSLRGADSNLLLEKVGCFAAGQGDDEVHPFVSETMYYESLYQEAGEDFMAIAIPKKDNPNAYQATVSTYGVIPQKSAEPELAFQLLKYLADAERPAFYDLTINKERIAEMLTSLQNTELLVTNSYTVQPMSAETAAYLQNVIDHIDSATLFDNKLWGERYEVLTDYIAGSTDLFSSAEKLMEVDHGV